MAEGAGAAANLIPADVDVVLTPCGFTNDNDRRKFWLAEGWSETQILACSRIKKSKRWRREQMTTNGLKSYRWSCEVEETESYFLLGSKTIESGQR